MSDKRPPDMTPEAVCALVVKFYPFKHVFPDSYRLLPSYYDRNIYFEGARVWCEGASESVTDHGRKAFILKISNSELKIEVVEGMNAMMFFLNERGVPCCCPIATREGSHVIAASKSQLLGVADDTQSDVKFTVRVLTYVPGVPMDKLEKEHIMTEELLYSVGQLAGKIDCELQYFQNSVIEARVEFWDLCHFCDIVNKLIPHLPDKEKRDTAITIATMFGEHVNPIIPQMKKGFIHNDVSNTNIILKKVREKYEIAGLLDFGECARTCCLFDAAAMVAYAQLEKENPVECVAPMIQGYRDVFPLSKEELNCLYYAVLARTCLSAVNGEYRFTLEPWNTYLLTTPANAWKVIKLMLTLTKQSVDKIWNIN